MDKKYEIIDIVRYGGNYDHVMKVHSGGQQVLKNGKR